MSKEGYDAGMYHLSAGHGIFDCNHRHLDDDGDVGDVGMVRGLNKSTMGLRRKSVEVQFFLQI